MGYQSTPTQPEQLQPRQAHCPGSTTGGVAWAVHTVLEVRRPHWSGSGVWQGCTKISVATKYQFQKTCTTKIISLLQCMRVVVIHSVVHHPGTLVLAISCRWQLFRLDAKEGRSAHSVAPSKFKEVHMVTRHWNLL